MRSMTVTAERRNGAATAGRDTGSTTRVAILVHHPIQHFSPAFRALRRTSLGVTGLYWEAREERYYGPGFERDIRWDIDLHSGYRWKAPRASRSGVGKLIELIR